ncbi:FAD-dependent monooxygenase andE [Colletotrichum orbiculare MAFF 240422]|uniref:FAD-dependent monooxygenase andE n=1 Tax=Colletotrichum orbiculare (strain 104-T / ATCC 96160 / CBS 514.97 / LARS 414 / MAFF 240422) TaxID=1213857 RepID=N4VJ80_COLOR|nr:FAD-dependent monooxygenase andE [Colletotrichum orbiculare MAFF 240422]
MGFKVIIAGGSVAGLTLANALEQFDIDYVLLEAYPTIAPQVGASIGMLPNGFRILDQLGCYEPVRNISDGFYLKSTVYGPDGKPRTQNSTDSIHHLEKRTGYPSIFIDRQMLLQVLYDNLKNKDKVLTKKRVSKVDMVKGGVQVHTEDGDLFEGDIVVGADGIHSAVRDEMWRVGHQESPGYFPRDEHSRVPVSTRCIFGISKRPKGMPDQTQHVCSSVGRSYLVVHAPGNRTYWFLFKAVEKTLRGKEIPRYSKEDLEKLAQEHLSDPICENVTFGSLYKNRIMATLVPLEEYVFEKWHYRRIITIGDASHKIDPMSGQGGNGAIEAAALLVNALTDMLEKNQKPSEAAVEAALAQVHTHRHERAVNLVAEAHQLQMILTGRSPMSKVVVNYLMPILGEEVFLKVAIPIAAASHRINRLPVPKRFRLVPFNDELPAPPIVDKTAYWAPWILAVGSLGALLYHTAQPSTANVLVDSFKALQGLLPSPETGLAVSRELVTSVITAESPAETLRLRANLFSTLALWLVEGNRYGNDLAVTTWPSACVAAYTLFGPKALLPSLGLSTLLLGSGNIPARHVPTNTAKSILPAVLLGYGVPTILASLPVQNPVFRQVVTVASNLSPLIAAGLSKVFPPAIQAVKNLVNPPEPGVVVPDEEKETFNDMYNKTDVAPLKRTYAFAAGVCAATHIATALYTAFETPGGAGGLLFSGSSGALFGLASVALSTYLTYDMRYRGFLTTKQAVAAGVANVVSNVLLGPGAAFSGFYYFREHVVSNLGS